MKHSIPAPTSARYVNHGTGKPNCADIFSANGSYSMAVVATGSLPAAATATPAINFCSRVLVAVSIRLGLTWFQVPMVLVSQLRAA